MSVENRNRLYLFGEYRKALASRKGDDLLIGRITQRESQMVSSIEKILAVLEMKGKLYTTEIQRSTKLYPNSINKVLKLLREKRVVKVRVLRKYNNKKIYSLNRDRAIIYLNRLISHKKRLFDIFKKISDDKKSFDRILKKLPDGFFKKEFQIFSSSQKKYNINLKQPILINELPYLLGKEIIFKFPEGSFCENCLGKDILSETIKTHDSNYCKNCGVETYD